MKRSIKLLSLILIALMSLFVLVSCASKTDNKTEKEITYTVVFTHDGEDIIKTVKAGGSVSMDDIPSPMPREHYNVIWDLNGISLSNISANITVHAWYTPVNYEVKWLDYDGTELEVDSTPYNTLPTFNSDNPVRAKDAQYEYTFGGWDKDIKKPIEGDTVFTAVYSTTTRKYTVSFSDGTTIIKSVQYEYGATPSYEDTIAKDSDAQYDYTFNGWDKEFTTVTQNTTYTAKWTTTLREYTIKFLDGDNNNEVIAESTLAYGADITAPSFPDADPGYHYEWDTEILSTVTGNATYTRTKKVNNNTPYRVEVLVPKYSAPVGDNKAYLPDTFELIDIASDFKDVLSLDDSNKGKGTTATTPDFSFMLNLPDMFKLDTLNSSYEGTIKGDGTTVYTFKYDINWEALGFTLSDIVSGYENGGYNHSSSYLTLGRAYTNDINNSAIGLKVHYDFEGEKSGNGTNFAIKLDHLDVSLYDSISVKYAAFTANVQGSYWAARLMIVGENVPASGWPLDGYAYQNYEVRTFEALSYLDAIPEMTHIDAIKFVYQRYQTINNMGEAGHTDYYITELVIKEKEDNRTVSFMNGDTEMKSYKVANGTVISDPNLNPTKEGESFIGWYDSTLKNEYDFTAPVTSDLTLYAKFEAAVKYKVVIMTEYYVRDGASQFTFPSTKEYRDATSEFQSMLGLLYDSEGNYYYGFGKLGTTPAFTELSNLPAVYGLVGSMPTDVISNDTVTYTFKYDINEEALGYPLSKIKVGWYNDKTVYRIGLFNEGEKIGFMIKADEGLNEYYSTPIQIIFDDLDVNNYQEIKIIGSAKYQEVSRNTAWYISGETNHITNGVDPCTKVMKWTTPSYTNFTLDVKDALLNPPAPNGAPSQQILKEIDLRPVAKDSYAYSILIEQIIVKQA